jgi:histidinol-phosphatase (PHP family)
MVWFSYHGGHSGEFCRHAKDSLAAVVESAVAQGFTHYGLSEHAPRFRAEDVFPDETDLGPDGLQAAFRHYAVEAIRLRDAYRERISLLVGFETERLPPADWARRMRAIRDSAAFDFVVGSVHDIDGMVVDVTPERTAAIAETLGGREAMQIRYFRALAELVATLKPEIVGHIDLIRKFDTPVQDFAPSVTREIEHVLEAAREAGSVLDVNCGAYRRGYGPVYPLPSILSKARAMGLRVTLGDDSHGVATVGVGLDACLAAIAKAGYASISYLERDGASVVWREAALADVKPRRH